MIPHVILDPMGTSDQTGLDKPQGSVHHATNETIGAIR